MLCGAFVGKSEIFLQLLVYTKNAKPSTVYPCMVIFSHTSFGPVVLPMARRRTAPTG